MAYSNYYKSPGTARIGAPAHGKHKFRSKGQIKTAVMHNARLGKSRSVNENYDVRRKDLNRDLLGDAKEEDIYVNLINRITGKSYTKENVPEFGKDDVYYADGKKLRASKDPEKAKEQNTVLAFELEANYPGDLIWCRLGEDGKPEPLPDGTQITDADIAEVGTMVLNENGTETEGKGYFQIAANKDEFEEWCKSAVEFAKTKYGEENVVSAQLHMDEISPHIHFIITPFTKDEKGRDRLRYGEVLGYMGSLAELQTEYANAVSHLGYKRGETNSLHINNISAREYKSRLSKEMSQELPKTLPEAHQMIKDLKVKNFDLDQRYEEMKVSAKRYQAARNKIDDQRKEIQELKKQLEETRRQIAIQTEHIFIENNKKRLIEDGKSIEPRKEVVQAYETMEQQFLTNGHKHMRDLGYSNEELRYWEDLNHDGINDRNQTIDQNKDGIRDGIGGTD